MDIRFNGKTALVTGAGKGIGRTLTLKLAEIGANVIAISRTQSDLDSLKQENPEKIQTLCLDIGNWENTKHAVQNIGPVDFLVNNAGVAEPKEFGDVGEEEIDRQMNINMKAVLNITQIIVNGMKSRGTGGAIVNVSSVAAIYGFPHFGVYASSKGALDQMTKCMAIEFGPHKIRVNAVNPTAVRTQMAIKAGVYDETNPLGTSMMARTPLGRFAEPEDIVGPIIFLLSDYAAMISGISVPIDGGLGICFA